MADRIAVIQDGALVQCGTPHEVYERPADRFVADFIGQMNFFSGTVEGSILRLDSGRDIRTGEAGSIGLGARAVAAVRPERLRLSASAADNTATGTVLALAYHGTDLQVHVATDLSPDPVLVRIAADAAERHSVQEGDAVELGWSARDTRLFPM